MNKEYKFKISRNSEPYKRICDEASKDTNAIFVTKGDPSDNRLCMMLVRKTWINQLRKAGIRFFDDWNFSIIHPEWRYMTAPSDKVSFFKEKIKTLESFLKSEKAKVKVKVTPLDGSDEAYYFKSDYYKVSFLRICEEASEKTNIISIQITEGKHSPPFKRALGTDVLLRTEWAEMVSSQWLYGEGEAGDTVMRGVNRNFRSNEKWIRVFIPSTIIGLSDKDVIDEFVSRAKKYIRRFGTIEIVVSVIA